MKVRCLRAGGLPESVSRLRAPRTALRPQPPKPPAAALRLCLLVADPGLTNRSEPSFGLGNALCYLIDVFQVRSSQPSVSPERPRWPSPASCAHIYPPSARNTAPPRPPPTSDAYRSTGTPQRRHRGTATLMLVMAVDAPHWHMTPPWHMSRHPRSMPHDMCNGLHEGPGFLRNPGSVVRRPIL